MKKIIVLAGACLTLLACDKKQQEPTVIEDQQAVKQQTETTQEDVTSIEIQQGEATLKEQQPAFNIQDIAISDVSLGEFPYLSLPKRLKVYNDPQIKEFDLLYIPIDGRLTAYEGKVYKAEIVLDKEQDPQGSWSSHYFLKSYQMSIEKLKGVKIFDGKITRENYEEVKDQMSYMGESTFIGYYDVNIQVYVIRQEDNSNVFIMLSADNYRGRINILQESQLDIEQ